MKRVSGLEKQLQEEREARKLQSSSQLNSGVSGAAAQTATIGDYSASNLLPGNSIRHETADIGGGPQAGQRNIENAGTSPESEGRLVPGIGTKKAKPVIIDLEVRKDTSQTGLANVDDLTELSEPAPKRRRKGSAPISSSIHLAGFTPNLG